MTYAEKLIELRKSKGYKSQNQFAIAVGLHSTHISGWENGKYNPSKEKLKEIITKLKLPQDYFVGCTPTPKRVVKKKQEQDTPRHMVIHHTPKKEIIVNNDATIEPLKKLKKSHQDEIQRINIDLITLKAKVEVLNNNISEIDILINEHGKEG